MKVTLHEEKTFAAAVGDNIIENLKLADSWRGMQCLLDPDGRELILDNGVFVRADGSLAEKLGATLLPAPVTATAIKHGETYAGVSIEEDGSIHHLIVVAGETENVTWQEAVAWAESIGARLPTCREQRILFANAKHVFRGRPYWSGEQHAGSVSYAWSQDFGGGLQSYWRKGVRLCARAVRKLPI